MRSRDGNCYRSLAICSIVFFSSLALQASEYLISYRYVVKNATIYNESLQVSHTMQPCKGKPTSFIELPILEDDNLHVVNTICVHGDNENALEFIDFLHDIGLDLTYQSVVANAIHTSTAIHTLKTTCFKVDFNDNFARISPLK